MTKKYLTTTEMQALERHAFENYPITLEQMMQNAGKAIFDVVMNEVLPRLQLRSVEQSPRTVAKSKPILVVAGKGNNGGDGLVAALLLHEKGIPITVLSPYSDDEFTEDAGGELKKVREAGIKVVENFDSSLSQENVENFDTLSKADHRNFSDFSLIIDALFGFSLTGNPRPPADEIINRINQSGIPILSVDVPSGLDVHTGKLGEPTVKATCTVALGMLKKGFEEHSDRIGKVYLGDLGIPKKAYLCMKYTPQTFIK